MGRASVSALNIKNAKMSKGKDHYACLQGLKLSRCIKCKVTGAIPKKEPPSQLPNNSAGAADLAEMPPTLKREQGEP